MSDEIVKKVNELLNEEKWTRATLNSYTINNFNDLDELINQALEREDRDAIKEICDEHLIHTKNSIIALYISGIIALNRQIIDDSNMVQLISIFLIITNGTLLNFFVIVSLILVKTNLHCIHFQPVMIMKMKKIKNTRYGKDLLKLITKKRI